MELGFADFGFKGIATGFTVFGIMSAVIFVLVIGIFIVTFVKSIGQWNKNNHSPRLSVPATIVAKRADVSHYRRNHGTGMHHSHSTTYYVTFQVESGDRMELPVAGHEYGMLIEGDRGELTFQGTR